MLVLNRRIDESIVIDNQITVSILAIDGDKVKIGISAPRDVPVFRQELWQAIQEQQGIVEKLAAGAEPSGFEQLRQFLMDAVGEAGE